MPISGKIAAVISETRIVINKGTLQGVSESMRFVIKLKIPEIIDPDNMYNKLTGIYFEKGNARIVKVFDSMSFADLEGKNVSNYVMMPSTTVEYPAVSENMLVSKDDWKIRVGDEVEEIFG